MNNKQILKNKLIYLEQALLEADFGMKQMAHIIDEMQTKIDKHKESGDIKDLEQNNDLIIELIKKRLDVGAKEYHQNVPIMPKDDITRDNFYEAVEEALDLSVYLSAYMLRLMEEKEQREFEPTTADEHNEKYLKEVKDDEVKESTA
tara:strand:+ start:865 stop:1305 length:441 start_codon:yes stop_codon:yes gene_type:complete